MRTFLTTTLLAGAVAAAGLTGITPARAAETCNGLPATIIGTDGNDHRDGTPGKDVFLMKGGDNTVSGLGGDDTACMGTGDDTFTGGPGDDTFVAEPFADGRDDFFGDDGKNQSGAADLATYAARTTAVNVSLDGSHNDGQAGEGDNIAGADVDAVRGGSGDDVLTERNVGQRTLFGGPGDDTLSGGFNLFAEAGDDTLIHIAGGGSGSLHGGDGADRLTDLANVKSDLQGEDGPDRISGGPGRDVLFGGAGDDRIAGGLGSESILGGDGNDLITGGLGDDVISGGTGDDTYLAGTGPDGRDVFFGEAGSDTANYGARDNASRGTVLNLSSSVFGNDGEPGEADTTDAENLKGGTGRNIITGDDRPNRLEGGPSFNIVTSIDGIGGNDVIIGHSAAGTDVCQGDAGPPPDAVHCP